MRERIRAARVAALYRRLPVAQVTVLLGGALVASVLSGAGRGRLAGWLVVLWSVVALRLTWWWRRRSRPDRATPAVWTRRLVVGALLNGLCWGALVVLAYARVGTPERLFIAAVLVGMVAGSASSTAGHVGGLVAFAMPTLAPVIGWSLLAGGPLEKAAGALACVFAAAMWALAREGARALTSSLVLQFRNESLVDQLTAARERLTSTNAGLEQRIRDRTAELVALEQQLSRASLLASLGSLSAAIAHDLNSPLASLLANLGVVEEELTEAGAAGRLIPGAIEALADVRACAERVRAIVRSLGDVAREDGPPGPLVLQEVIDACLTVATPQLRTRLRVVRDLGPPITVRADRATLAQALLALLLRIGRADPAAGRPDPEVRVSVRPGGEGTVAVELVRSGGAAQVADATPDGEVLQLPLSLTHAAVARLGGRVVELAEDGRVGFTLVLPMVGRPGGAPGA